MNRWCGHGVPSVGWFAVNCYYWLVPPHDCHARREEQKVAIAPLHSLQQNAHDSYFYVPNKLDQQAAGICTQSGILFLHVYLRRVIFNAPLAVLYFSALATSSKTNGRTALRKLMAIADMKAASVSTTAATNGTEMTPEDYSNRHGCGCTCMSD